GTLLRDGRAIPSPCILSSAHRLRDRHSFPTRRSSDLVVGRVELERVVVDPVADRGLPAAAVADREVVTCATAHGFGEAERDQPRDRKSTRLNSSHQIISYAVFCLKKKQELRAHAQDRA